MNEWMVDVTEFLVQKFSGTQSFLERGGDECDNLNFMNFKIDTFKIRKKIVNFRKFWNW